LSALGSLVARLIAIGVLAVAFVALTLVISAGVLVGVDHDVAQAMHQAWRPALHPLLQVIAELGGVEVTTLLMLGLCAYLWRTGSAGDAFVAVVFVAVSGFELFYKFNLLHLGPPPTLAQADGPSLSELVMGAGAGNSFPSGHVVRSVVVYGLIGFVVWRLAQARAVRRATVAACAVIVLLVSADRLYLNVHWESDVIGGLILGLIGLLAGTVWLDRPRPVSRPQN
jgi:membrane-associated phospholipid phosphatase